MTAVDRILLVYEFGRELGVCLDCGQSERHGLGCQWDEALSERGYTSPEQRRAARASVDTERPPAGSGETT